MVAKVMLLVSRGIPLTDISVPPTVAASASDIVNATEPAEAGASGVMAPAAPTAESVVVPPFTRVSTSPGVVAVTVSVPAP